MSSVAKSRAGIEVNRAYVCSVRPNRRLLMRARSRATAAIIRRGDVNRPPRANKEMVCLRAGHSSVALWASIDSNPVACAMQQRDRDRDMTVKATCKLRDALVHLSYRAQSAKGPSKRTKAGSICLNGRGPLQQQSRFMSQSTLEACRTPITALPFRTHHQTKKAPKSSLTRGLFLESWW